MKRAGEVSIRIDLKGAPVAEAPVVVALSVRERDITISDSGRTNRCSPEHPGSKVGLADPRPEAGSLHAR